MGWGIAGCGWVARDYVGPAIVESANGALIGLFDPDAVSRRRAKQAFDVPAFDDLAAFLAVPGLGAVYVAAPNHAHRALVEAAAAAGLPVLCEKPMATTMGDAEAMVAACGRAGVRYATAFDQRFHAAHQALAGMIAEGRLGTVTAIRIVYACWLPADWGGSGAGDNWRIDPRRAGGGALMDLAPHGLDLCAMLLGEPLVDVLAMGQARVHHYKVEDGAVLMARSRSGVLVQMHVAYNCPETLPRRRLEVVGTAGHGGGDGHDGADGGRDAGVHRCGDGGCGTGGGAGGGAVAVPQPGRGICRRGVGGCGRFRFRRRATLRRWGCCCGRNPWPCRRGGKRR